MKIGDKVMIINDEYNDYGRTGIILEIFTSSDLKENKFEIKF